MKTFHQRPTHSTLSGQIWPLLQQHHLRDEEFVVLLLHLAVPLPAPANAGHSSAHAWQEGDQLEHNDDGRQHQAEHEARRRVPLVRGDFQELLGAVQVGVQGAEEERQVTQLGLEGERNQVRQTERQTDPLMLFCHTFLFTHSVVILTSTPHRLKCLVSSCQSTYFFFSPCCSTSFPTLSTLRGLWQHAHLHNQTQVSVTKHTEGNLETCGERMPSKLRLMNNLTFKMLL